MIAIHSWQATNGGCPLCGCSYLQWHGKSNTTCPVDKVFLSNGFGKLRVPQSQKKRVDLTITFSPTLLFPVAPRCYSDPALPVNRIKAQLNLWFPLDPPRHHATPPDDPSCTQLTGTDNLFGRYINGVRPDPAACTTSATPCGGADFGQFVHIEQDSVSRDAANWDKWANVILGAFPCIPLHISAPEQQVVM